MMNPIYTKEVYRNALKGPKFANLEKSLINLLWSQYETYYQEITTFNPNSYAYQSSIYKFALINGLIKNIQKVHYEPEKLIGYIEIKGTDSSVSDKLFNMIKQLLKQSKWEENKHQPQLQKEEKIDFFIICSLI